MEGVNAYTGATQVVGGTLQISNGTSGSLTGGGTVTVAGGTTTLAGAAVLSGGAGSNAAISIAHALAMRSRKQEKTSFAEGADVDATLTLAPTRLSLGERLGLSATVTSTSRKPQRLVIDYVIHYVKASGGSAAKVFKWTEIELKAGERLELTRTQVIRDFTTRKHYSGSHQVELQINGQRVASAAFDLSCA